MAVLGEFVLVAVKRRTLRDTTKTFFGGKGIRIPDPLHAMSLVSIILLVGVPGSEGVREETYVKNVYIA